LTAVRQAMIDYQLLCLSFVVRYILVVDSGFFMWFCCCPVSFFTLHLAAEAAAVASKLAVYLAGFVHLTLSFDGLVLVKGTMKSIQCILLRLYDHRWPGAYWALSFLVMSYSTIYQLFVAFVS